MSAAETSSESHREYLICRRGKRIHDEKDFATSWILNPAGRRLLSLPAPRLRQASIRPLRKSFRALFSFVTENSKFIIQNWQFSPFSVTSACSARGNSFALSSCLPGFLMKLCSLREEIYCIALNTQHSKFTTVFSPPYPYSFPIFSFSINS